MSTIIPLSIPKHKKYDGITVLTMEENKNVCGQLHMDIGKQIGLIANNFIFIQVVILTIKKYNIFNRVFFRRNIQNSN